MTKNKKPVVILIGGINGAGKTTLYYHRIKPFLDKQVGDIPFVNADELEAARYPNEVGQHSLAMGKLAAQIRAQNIKAGQSFVTETVFSHESKNQLIDDARKAGFMVVLNHVHVDSPALAYLRVQTRVIRGGHAVPKDKVFSRYERTVVHILKASMSADKTYVWDNSIARSEQNVGHRFVMAMEKGKITKLANTLPDWASAMYSMPLKAYQQQKAPKPRRVLHRPKGNDKDFER